MITLTAPNGMKFKIDPAKISVEGPAVAADPKAKSMIRIDGENHAVLETNDEIDRLIGAQHD